MIGLKKHIGHMHKTDRPNKTTTFKNTKQKFKVGTKPIEPDYEQNESCNFCNEEFQGRRKIEIVKNQVMPFLQGVEEARYYVDQALKEQEKEKDLEKIAAKFEATDFMMVIFHNSPSDVKT